MRSLPLAWVLAAAASLAGCSALSPSRFVGDRAPPPAALAREVSTLPAPGSEPTSQPSSPAPEPPPPAPRSLADLVDLALRTDPATRAAWQDARSAAAAAGGRRTLYLPTLDLSSSLVRQQLAGTPTSADAHRTALGASAGLTWLLLDQGARSALVDEADRLALAARLSEQAAVGDLVLRVQQTWYGTLAARALVDAEAAAVKQAETSLAAAEDRRKAGVATLADVLQARTALSQARLALQQLEGQALVLQGALATLAGLPPTAELDVGPLPAEVKPAEAEPAVEALLLEAAARSPDLARARAVADAAGARANAAAVAWLPTLSGQAGYNRTWWLAPGSSTADGWSVGLVFRFPLLEGTRPAWDALAARAQADAARSRAEATGQSVALQVWSSFQQLRTAGRRLDTSRDLLASAGASTEVARGRYREGVGSIVDLLTAQAALEGARAEEVRARLDYLLALAQLARTTGRLPRGAEATASAGGSP